MTIDTVRSYEITPRPAALGGGWNLVLFQGGDEAGGGVFPIAEESPLVGMTWWNLLTEELRAHWLMMAASAVPAAARYAFLLAEAYTAAQDEGQAWSVNGH